MRILAALLATAVLAQTGPDALEWRLYRAAMAAAGSALQLGDVTGARRWLTEAPERRRGWEWRYLDAASNQSTRSVAAHAAPITGLAVSPEARFVATTSSDKSARVFDAVSGERVALLEGHTASAWSPAFRPGHRQLATLGSDGTVRLWDLARGGAETQRFEKLGSGLGALAFSPDGRLLAAGTWKFTPGRGVTGHLYLWDLEAGRQLWTAAYGVKPITAIAFRPDGQQFAVATWDSVLGLFSPAGDGKPAAEAKVSAEDGSYSALQSVSYSADGARVAAGSKDNSVYLFSSRDARVLRRLHGHIRWSNAAIFLDRGGEVVVSGSSDTTIRLWRGERVERTLAGHTASVVGLAPAGESLVSASADGTLRWWPLRDRAQWKAPDTVYGLAFDASGNRMATASWKGAVKLWDAATGRGLWEKSSMHQGSANAVTFSPDGRRLVTGGNDGRTLLLNAADGAVLAEWEEVSDGRAAVAVFAPDGSAVLVPSSRPAGKLWDPATGKAIATINGGKGELYAAAFSPDSRKLAVGWTDGTVRLLDWKSGVRDAAPLAPLPGGAYSLAFSPSGQELLVAGGRIVRVVEAERGTVRWEGKSHTELIYSADWSPDGTRIASGSVDQTVRIWSAATGEELLAIPFGAQVYLVRFAPDGRRLAVAPMDGGNVTMLEAAGAR